MQARLAKELTRQASPRVPAHLKWEYISESQTPFSEASAQCPPGLPCSGSHTLVEKCSDK